MKLIHYSKNKIDKLIKNFHCEKYINFVSGYKPVGFWVSVKKDWGKWCEDEEFKLDNLEYKYNVKLKKIANLLILKSEKEINDFTDKYGKDFIFNNIDLVEKFYEIQHKAFYETFKKKMEKSIFSINWEKLREEYDGIIISPYQWSCRMRSKFSWYYGWDCASGCIWNIDAIEGIKLIKK